MDPLSVAASIIAVVQLTGFTIGFLNDLKGTSNDRTQCVIEMSNVSHLLVTLMCRVNESSSDDAWFVEVQALAAANGPIDQYRSALEQLQSKITSSSSSRTKVGAALSWKFSKEEVVSVLTRIDRLKSLTQIALGVDHFKLSQEIKNDTAAITSGVELLQESRDSEQYRVITDWLSSTDFSAQQSDFIARRQEGTGDWFIISPEFINWLKGTKQTLFCPGIPGAGKTMIAAIAVDHIWKAFQGNNIGVAYVFCNYKRQEKQTVSDLLAAILKQLVQERPSYGDPVATLYKVHTDRRTRPSLDEICTALYSVINNYSKAYIIIDALDECTDSDGTRSELISALRNLQVRANTQLMVTSRFIARIEELFEESPMLEIRANEADVRRYVAGQLCRLPKCVQRDPELRAEIQDGIARAVDGMFLLARLHVESLRGKMSKKLIRLALKNLPKGLTALDEAYDEAIERIKSQLPEEYELAKRVLSWITYARRHLTIKELSHALAVEAGESELDKDNIPDVEDIISVCAGLVAVDEESDIIRLVHYTTQDYFERVREVWNPTAQEEITSTCLTYLSFKTFNTNRCDNDADLDNRIEQNSFIDYAAKYWGRHALTAQQAVKELAISFLCNTNLVSCSTQVMFSGGFKYPGYSQHMLHNLTSVHVAAMFGLAYLLQELMHSDGNKNCLHIDGRDSRGRTPLSWAAQRGHKAIVKLLVERGGVVTDSKDDNGKTPLLHAAEGGYEAIVKLLLEQDDVVADLKDNNGQTPLSHAAERGYEAIVKLLVDRDDVVADMKGNNGQTPLSHAAKNGHEAIVKLLVNRGDVVADSEEIYGQTPLWLAARNGHEAIVKLLIERYDAAADWKDIYSRTPLSAAAKRGHEAIVKLLVNRDDVEADWKDHHGQTPLSYAAENGHEEIVELLSERGDVVADSRDDYDQTPLLLAARNGHTGSVKFLVERHDVMADVKEMSGATPLTFAARNGHEAIVRLLVERNDVIADSKDNKGKTPLLWAAEQGNEAVVKLLIERDDVAADSEDEVSHTALRRATLRGHKDIVKLLLSLKNIVATGSKDTEETMLFLASEFGHTEIVALFIERGNPADSRGTKGRTPLSIAAGNGHRGVVNLLLERDDVIPDSEDNNGRTPLWWAKRQRATWHEKIEKLLIDRIAKVKEAGMREQITEKRSEKIEEQTAQEGEA